MSPDLDEADSQTPFMQVAADLHRQIADGTLEPGERLPGTRRLAEQYRVAPNTVTSALRWLKSQGLVRSERGRGTFVRDAVAPPALPTSLGDLLGVRDDVRRLTERMEALEARLADVEGHRVEVDPHD